MPSKTMIKLLPHLKQIKSFPYFYKKLVYKQFRKPLPYTPFYHLQDDFDCLIILDACRYDYFRILHRCKYVLSAGTATPEWLYRNLKAHNPHNLVYISANPYASRYKLKEMGINPNFVIKSALIDLWNTKIDTVLPSEFTKFAINTIENHPTQKYIIHYMQPHTPYLKPLLKAVNGIRLSVDADELAMLGFYSKHKIRKAYFNNLKLVWKYVRKLLKHLSGKIIISSDHGNLLGEYDLFGHPPCFYVPELVKVPYLVIKK